MYAIVEINGQQFKAEAGKKLFVHHIQNAENGATVEFDKVLLVDKDGNITVGAPTVEGAKVVCQVVSNMVTLRYLVAKLAKQVTSSFVKEVLNSTRVITSVWEKTTLFSL